MYLVTIVWDTHCNDFRLEGLNSYHGCNTAYWSLQGYAQVKFLKGFSQDAKVNYKVSSWACF